MPQPPDGPDGAPDFSPFRATAGGVMTHHHVVRDGSVWLCSHCKHTWPYPSPVPKDAEPCTPRPWGRETR